MKGGTLATAVGYALAAWRSAAGLSQRELARRCQVSQSTASRWEAGKVEPSITALLLGGVDVAEVVRRALAAEAVADERRATEEREERELLRLRCRDAGGPRDGRRPLDGEPVAEDCSCRPARRERPEICPNDGAPCGGDCPPGDPCHAPITPPDLDCAACRRPHRGAYVAPTGAYALCAACHAEALRDAGEAAP